MSGSPAFRGSRILRIADNEAATIFLTDADVRAAFDWSAAIAALRSTYSAPVSDAMFPPRTMARGDGIWLRTLSGVLPDQTVLGAKLISCNPREHVVSYLVALFDQRTMALVALLDANSITGFRTAATSALAADLLANADARHVAVIGSGFEARAHVRALAAIRPIDRLAVFSPRETSRAAFAADLAELGFPILQTTSAADAVAGADIVICAARSRDETPTIDGAWLAPGMTVVSIGSTLPEQRELDAKTIERAALIVADMQEEVALDSGDMIAARAEGVEFESKLVSLAEVVGGTRAGRTNREQIIIYKSVGAAAQDLAVSLMCVERARRLELGTLLPVSVAPVHKGK